MLVKQITPTLNRLYINALPGLSLYFKTFSQKY